ncbi:MAG: hypothetical protein A3F88_03905 [Deltaproteobacteria bacterium RIFCSPLOWO2_12_FULL_42_16]|nr:MAG: hypothetical protein A3F88_03905 [Deltaproteobacteria bacterium RIFCSPLOWO2_12_FULL_42_16]
MGNFLFVGDKPQCFFDAQHGARQLFARLRRADAVCTATWSPRSKNPPFSKGGLGGFERGFSEQKNPVYILNFLIIDSG